MYVSRILLPAILVLTPWLNAYSWGQDYTAMQKAYGGALPTARSGAVPTARNQFSLRNQATRPPMFPDQQVNDYTAMSPNSWGHPVTRGNQIQPRPAVPSYATPSYATAPSYAPAPTYAPAPSVLNQQYISDSQAVSPNQEMVLSNSPLESEAEQQAELAPLTNTADRRIDQELSNATDSDVQSPKTNSSDQQRSGSAGERYAQAQDFPFDGPEPSMLKKTEKSIFPFTRKELVAPVAPLEELTGSPLLEAQEANSTPIDLDSPSVLSPQLPSTTESEVGLYTTPRNISPVTQAPLIQTQPLPQQQFLPQQPPVPNQPATGFNYPNESTTQINQWQHPNGTAGFQPSGGVVQQAPSFSQLGSRQQVPNWTSMIQTRQAAAQLQPNQEALPNFRPDLGHRAAQPTVRGRSLLDDGKKFDHEKKKVDYPPFKEIIATGKFFYNAEVNALRPSFLGNTGLSVDGAEFSESQPFDFATTYAPLIKFGFESQYGPGVELSYFNVTENANTLGATNSGTGSVASIASVTGPGRLERIGADNVGETLTADHSFELETIGLNFFKELKFPISRLNGKFGFVYANVAQSLLVDVTDATGASTGQLINTTDFRGYGPQFALEYFRPVGHTPLTLVTSFGGKGLFGRRDQFVNNDAGLVQRRFGADEFITVIDFAGGVQLKKLVADGRYWTAKVGYLHQTWLGGGTAVDPQGDFGISGFTFGIGYNR